MHDMRQSKQLHLLLTLIALLGVLGCASAEITESKSSIVGSRTHKFLKALSDKLSFLDTEIPTGHAVAALSTSGCNIDVLVVGPINGNVTKYAKSLDVWRAKQGFPGVVKWSQEDDCAAASFSYRPGKFGMSHATTTVDLVALREAVISAEPNTQFAVVDAVWSRANLGVDPDVTAASAQDTGI